jgi:hypothetical protein
MKCRRRPRRGHLGRRGSSERGIGCGWAITRSAAPIENTLSNKIIQPGPHPRENETTASRPQKAPRAPGRGNLDRAGPMARGLGARERATTPNTISAGLFRYQTDPDAAPATSGSKQPQDDRRQSLYADRMDNRMTAIERAFQLARSGRASTVAAIDRALKHEGYGARQIEGPALRRQLAALIKATSSTP